MKLEARNLKPRCRKSEIRINILRDEILSQNFAAKFQTPNLISQNSKRQILRRKIPCVFFKRLNSLLNSMRSNFAPPLRNRRSRTPKALNSTY